LSTKSLGNPSFVCKASSASNLICYVRWLVESRFVGQGTTEEVRVHVKLIAFGARLCLSYIAVYIARYQ
jgi:hypothetical protein